MNTPTAVKLLTTLDSTIQKVHTQSLDLSFNELLDMCDNQELNITPEYQRLVQWSEGARSRFIESLLLEMPVPPIYVLEEDDGRYTLIDGLQRISSYLHLRGRLSAPHLDPPVKLGDKLILQDCDIVGDLNGLTFDDLGATLQIKLKRAFVTVQVVRKGSDSRFKYHMFKRLNQGGTMLSAQQLRNCTIRLLDSKFNDFIARLSQTEHFREATESITQQGKLVALDQELVLRFFAFKNDRSSFKHDVADFLTEFMEKVSDPAVGYPFDYVSEEACFLKTFELLNRSLNGQAFTYANKTGDKLTRGFSVYHFEAITVGVQSHLARMSPDDTALIDRLREELTKIKLHPEFIRITTGGGKNSPGPLQTRINFVDEALKGV